MLYTPSNPGVGWRGGGGGGGGAYSGFQVAGMMEGFFLGLKFSISGFSWVEKFCQGIFWGCLI